jgi:hypothetical protein
MEHILVFVMMGKLRRIVVCSFVEFLQLTSQ